MPESFIIADGYSSTFLMNDNRDNTIETTSGSSPDKLLETELPDVD